MMMRKILVLYIVDKRDDENEEKNVWGIMMNDDVLVFFLVFGTTPILTSHTPPIGNEGPIIRGSLEKFHGG